MLNSNLVKNMMMTIFQITLYVYLLKVDKINILLKRNFVFLQKCLRYFKKFIIHLIWFRILL